MKIIISISLIILGLPSFAQVNQELKKQMFCDAMQNVSSSPNYVVINVKNPQTDIYSEVCIDNHSLFRLLRDTDTANYLSDCDKNPDLRFDFNEDPEGISYLEMYSQTELNFFEDSIKNSDVWKGIMSGKIASMNFGGSKYEQQLMFAHILFNHGFMVSRSCLAGNMISFYPYKKSVYLR